MQPTQYLVKRISVFITFILGLAILLATSPSDIPSIDAEIKAELTEENKVIEFQVKYRQGPVDFSTYPLMISINIEHQEVSEDFGYDNQSWTMVTETLDGQQNRQKVAVRRGSGDIFTVDKERLTLDGLISLFACPSESEESEELCIPCDVEATSCDFIFSMVREGAPYPAETIRMNLSQWANEGSTFTLDVSRR